MKNVDHDPSTIPSRAWPAFDDTNRACEGCRARPSTVIDFEKERRTISDQAAAAIRSALEAAGVEFIPENGGGAGVRLAKPGGAGA